MIPSQVPGFAGTLFTATVAFTLLLSLLLLSVLSFVDSRRGQGLVRRLLGWRLAGTRMSRMLEYRHVQPQFYLQNAPIATIRAQLRNCRQCMKQEQCEAALNYRGPRHRSLAFCPNHSTIDNLIELKTGALRRR